MTRHPSLLLLDEPLSALDLPTRTKLRGELRELLRRLAIPSVVVTHDWEEAFFNILRLSGSLRGA